MVHAGRGVEAPTGAVTPSIVMSTTFARDDEGALVGDFIYGRHDNPTRARLEESLTALETGAEASMAFASGCAVAHALFSTLSTGDAIVVSDDIYYGIRHLYRTMADRLGIRLLEVDLTDEAASAAAAEAAPKLWIVETPSNPMMKVVDIDKTSAVAHAAGATVVVDNTFATPWLQSPLALGADMVMCSTTKFLSGHSDVTGGALWTRDAKHPTYRAAVEIRQVGGAVPSPFDCWLLLRSIATLPLRVERQCDNAERLAAFLESHDAVAGVLYPGLERHPGHAIAARQMRRPGAMLSLLVRGDGEATRRVMARLSLVVRATSLGAVHTLAEHRYVVEGEGSQTPPNLIRLSVGIEAYEDLEADLDHALAAVATDRA